MGMVLGFTFLTFVLVFSTPFQFNKFRKDGLRSVHERGVLRFDFYYPLLVSSAALFIGSVWYKSKAISLGDITGSSLTIEALLQMNYVLMSQGLLIGSIYCLLIPVALRSIFNKRRILKILEERENSVF